MTQFLQFHILTSYPPSNLNRDDNGTPKTAIFGGARRLRVSSQSLKRAWRTSDVFSETLNNRMGQRTQRIGKVVEDHLLARSVDPQKARSIAREAAALFGKVKPEGDEDPTFTEQLAFIAPEEREKVLLLSEQRANGTIEEMKSNEILMKADGAADIAMFGRMLAGSPQFNREAAVQVAHAITTHKFEPEDDYYVAVDDLKDRHFETDSGTSFIGVQEFGAGTFYLYICIDVNLLKKNLSGEENLARDAIEALIRAAATVPPKGKIASFASRAYASFIMAEAGTSQPRSLAAAFLEPVRAGSNDQATESVEKLQKMRERLNKAYGEGDVSCATMNIIGKDPKGTLDDVIAFASKAVSAP
jgi:CRISPR system Cascade subunit CasC